MKITWIVFSVPWTKVLDALILNMKERVKQVWHLSKILWAWCPSCWSWSGPYPQHEIQAAFFREPQPSPHFLSSTKSCKASPFKLRHCKMSWLHFMNNFVFPSPLLWTLTEIRAHKLCVCYFLKISCKEQAVWELLQVVSTLFFFHAFLFVSETDASSCSRETERFPLSRSGAFKRCLCGPLTATTQLLSAKL